MNNLEFIFQLQEKENWFWGFSWIQKVIFNKKFFDKWWVDGYMTIDK